MNDSRLLHFYSTPGGSRSRASSSRSNLTCWWSWCSASSRCGASPAGSGPTSWGGKPEPERRIPTGWSWAAAPRGCFCWNPTRNLFKPKHWKELEINSCSRSQGAELSLAVFMECQYVAITRERSCHCPHLNPRSINIICWHGCHLSCINTPIWFYQVILERNAKHQYSSF